jgi:hypothetical protein
VVHLEDYRSNTSGAKIHWFYDGDAIPDADNERDVTVTAPVAGKTAVIKAVLEYNGLSETFTKEIKPLYLDIIIEPQTHVPSFYIGRPLPSVGSIIHATALLNDGTSLGTDYVYTWQINDTFIGSGPIRGGNVVNFPMPQGSAAVLSLQVSSVNGSVIAKRVISLLSAKPELQYYEVNTLLGLIPKAIYRSFNFIGNSAIIRIEPYYLDSTVFNKPSILTWKINNAPVTPNNNPYEVTLERTGNPGDAKLGFEVRSTIQLLQGVKGELNLHL